MTRTVLIYAITRTETGDCYVGSTISQAQRWAHHKSLLRHQKHHCSHLQRAWDKYGADAFVFEELHSEPFHGKSERFVLETKWIKRLATYNTMVPAERAGQFTITEEDRLRRRAAALTRIAGNPVYAAQLAKRGAELAAAIRSPEGRANMGAHTKRRWQDPVERAKLAKGLENRWADPDARDKHAETMRQVKLNDGGRQSEALKAAWADPEKRAKLKARQESRWNDPEAKARQAEKMRAYHAARRAIKT